MSKISVFAKGTVIALVVALVFSSVVFAKGKTEKTPATPVTTATSSQANTQLMQNNWKSELAWLKFDNAILGRVDKVLNGVLARLDKVSRNHKTIARVGGKLGMTLREVEALLAKAQSIVTANAGFDASGNVSNQAQALQSIQQLGAALRALRGTLIYRLEHLL